MQVQVLEGDQMLSSTVNDNDSFYQEESGSEHEQDNVPTETEESDYETENDGSEKLSDESEEEGGAVESLPYRIPIFGKTYKDKIRELDEEMKDHIIDLHRSMTEQGMHGAADLLQDCFDHPAEMLKVDGEVSIKLPKSKSVKQKYNTSGSNVNQNATARLPIAERSGETIYDNAVPKHNSSSSEDGLELSDESLNNDMSCLFADRQSKEWSKTPIKKTCQSSREHLQPSTSGLNNLTPQQRVDSIIKQAEVAKAKIFLPTGELTNFQSIERIDQDYQLVGSHIDDNTRVKIISGQYVDFSELLP